MTRRTDALRAGPLRPGSIAGALRPGLIGGAVALLLCLVGMVAAFADRAIVSGVVSLGFSLILIVFFGAGHASGPDPAASQPGPSGASRLGGPARGAVAGLAAATILVALVVLGGQINLRAMFINATPELYGVLTFDRGAPLGLALLWAVGAAAGAAGAAARRLPAAWRRVLRAGALGVLLIGLLGDQITLILDHHDLAGLVRGRFLAAKGVTPLGAGLIFAAAAGLAFAWHRWRGPLGAAWAGQTEPRQERLRLGGFLAALALTLALPRIVGVYHSEVLNQIGLALLMGLGLNIVVGFAGMLDLGYVAFFALGAYTIGVLTSPESFLFAGTGRAPWTYWEALPAAILVALGAGVLLGVPVLRMRGDYLAIVTLGFGEIIRLLALSTWLQPYLGGAQGIADIPPISLPWIAFGERCAALGLPVCLARLSISGPNKPQLLFSIVFAAVLVAAYVSIRLKDSRFGRAWMAMREDEDVAEAMGIHLVRTKLLAFAAGAALSGLSGTLFAVKLGSIYPHSFGLIISINILALIIVGGMGSIPGVVVGALVLVGLPELLREFVDYRLMVYGAVLVLMMLRRPEGLVPNTVVRREMHGRNDAGGDVDGGAAAAQGV